MMKILIVGDLHGVKSNIYFKDFDCIVQPGDVCSDKELRKYTTELWKYSQKTGTSLNLKEYMNKKHGGKSFDNLVKKSVDKGKKILEFLCSFGKPVYFVPGNWDFSMGKSRIKKLDTFYRRQKSTLDGLLYSKTRTDLISGLKNLRNCQYILQKNNLNFLGYGNSGFSELPLVEKYSKKEFEIMKKTYKKILEKLNSLYLKRNKKTPTIFISHNIPFNTKLDKITNKDSPAYNKHFGSNIARDFIIKHKPLICIGAHIHERPGRDKIGETIIINAGFGRDANTLIDINEKTGKIRSIKFHKS